MRGMTKLALVLTGSFLVPGRLAGEPHGRQVGDWPQWRGPERNAVVSAGPDWPSDLAGLSKRWHVRLGPGYSGPIVSGDRVYVAETVDRKREIVRALDRDTGREIWKVDWPGAISVPFFAKSNGDWIRSTPTCDGDSLYIGGMEDVLVCLSAETGAERWRVDFKERYGTPAPAFGFVCSPLIDGEDLYVQAAGSCLKLNKKTGKTIWRALETPGGMYDSAFSSPAMATLAGRRQAIFQTRELLAGLDCASGDVLWSIKVPSFRGMNILTPTVFGDGVFTSTHKNRTFFYQVACVDGTWTVKEAWTDKAQGYMSSPVVIEGHAYLHLGNGRLCCFDLKSGRRKWRSKAFGKYWSVAARGDLILALDERGELLLIRADPDAFRLLDRRTVSEEETWGHIAVCGSEIFIRELHGLSAYRWNRIADGGIAD